MIANPTLYTILKALDESYNNNKGLLIIRAIGEEQYSVAADIQVSAITHMLERVMYYCLFPSQNSEYSNSSVTVK